MQPSQLVAAKAAEHGRNIFLYNNIRTNQVIYSLTRTIYNHGALKQLTFVGKKTKPASIRKDVWQPLATVTFPSGTQGLWAYRLLREYRKLRETDWEPEPGKTRKQRARKLMDQKATSIADLSAILYRQEARAKELAAANEERARFLEEVKEEEARCRENQAVEKWSILERRAQLAEGGSVKRFDEHIRSLVAKKSGASSEEKKSIKKLMSKLRRRRDVLKRAQEAVAAKGAAQSTGTAAQEPTSEVLNAVTIARDTVLDAVVRRARTTRNGRTLLPVAWPKNFRKIRHKLEAAPGVPPVSLEGVKVQWANIHDAEYAESWPEPVVHDLLGLANHTAPDPNVPLTTWQAIDEKWEEKMEENIQLDGEASEEGGEDQETPEESEKSNQQQGQDSVPERVEKPTPKEGQTPEESQAPEQAAAPQGPSGMPRSRLRSLFTGRQAAEPSDRPKM